MNCPTDGTRLEDVRTERHRDRLLPRVQRRLARSGELDKIIERNERNSGGYDEDDRRRDQPPPKKKKKASSFLSDLFEAGG